MRVNAIDERDYESFPEVLEGLPIPKPPAVWTIPPVIKNEEQGNNELIF
jgi:hypothetical protein